MIKLLAMLLCVFLGACSPKKVLTNSVDAKSLRSQGLDKYNEGYQIGQDENGFAKVKSSKQSSFEKKRLDYAERNSEFEKKISKDNFDLQRWQGNKKKSFAPWSKSKKTFNKPEFLKQNSEFASKSYEREPNQIFNKSFKSEAARERGSNGFDKSLDRKVAQRRRVYPEPRVVDQSEYNKAQGAGLSVSDAKRMLGN